MLGASPWWYVLGIALLGVAVFAEVRRKRPYSAGGWAAFGLSQAGLFWGRFGHYDPTVAVVVGVLIIAAAVLFFMSFRRGELASRA